MSYNATAIAASTTIAGLPTAGVAGRMIRASNFGTKGALMMDDGTRWKPANGVAILKTLDAQTSTIANSETVVFQYLFPAALWTAGDRVRLFFGMIKSGTTDTGVTNVRIGASGTTGDPVLINLTAMSAAQRQGSWQLDLRLDSATSVITLPNSRAPLGYGTPITTAYDAALAVPNATTTGFYVNLSMFSISTNDTVSATHAEMTYLASGN